MKVKVFFAGGILSLTLLGCVSNEECKPGFFLKEPASSSITVAKGKTLEFAVAATSCTGDLSFAYEWSVNGVVQGYENAFRYYACEASGEPVNVTVEATNSSGESVEATWSIKVTNPGRISRPREVLNAINVVRGVGRQNSFDPNFPALFTDSVNAFKGAIQVLTDYIENTNACDLEANYADGMARFVLALTQVPQIYQERQNMTPEDVFRLIEEDLRPVLDRLDAVRRLGDDSFSFKIDNLFIVVLEDLPDVEGSQYVALDLSGEHDYTDVLFFSSAAEGAMAGMHMSIAYNGLIAFGLSIPSPEQVEFLKNYAADPTSAFILESEVINRLESDQTFLRLIPPDKDGIDGAGHLRIAQKLIVASMEDFISAMKSLISEPSTPDDPQDDDLIRYWDCGKDGVCPGDGEERVDPSQSCEDQNGNVRPYTDYNLNGKCNPPHCDTNGDGVLELTPKTNPYDPKVETTCVAPDEGEGNGQFDNGEPAGIEFVRIFSNEKRRYSLPVQNNYLNAIQMIADNVKGVDKDGDGEPDRLDLNALAYQVAGVQNIETLMRTFQIPIPDIRLAEFFITPSNLRDFVPLYAKPECGYHSFSGQFILSNEFERFRDAGYDDLYSKDEPNYDPLTNPDPHHDDFNLSTNSTDGWDNDSDGSCAPDECSKCRQNYNNPNYNCDDARSGLNLDIGVEGNFMWDCKSPQEDQGGIRCQGEHERYFDEGLFDGEKFVSSNDGIYTRLDIDHYWPSGGCVGGAPVEITRDPKNGVSDLPNADGMEKNGNLYDPFYAFFPDPTFSGVLEFPDDIKNSNGESLTKNAKLMRFITKLYNLAISFIFSQ